MGRGEQFEGKSQNYLLKTGLDKVLREHVPVGDMKSSIMWRQKCFVCHNQHIGTMVEMSVI